MTANDNGTLVEHFLEQVRKRPDAVAVSAGETDLTYAQLHHRAKRVAHGLARRGVTRETAVALAFTQSAEAIVAILGVVLAGGAYVPVNPAFPAARIADLLDDSDARMTVCAADVADAVRAVAPPSTTVVTLAELDPDPAADLPPFVTPPAAPGQSPLAYVMYTSGSTGRPKGVMVEHRGICRLVLDTDYARFGPGERFLQISALEFDAATLEIWGALLHGARLYVVDRETAVVPWRLAEALREYGITFLWLTAALFNQLVEEDPAMFAGLTTLITGGDVLSPRHVAAVRRHCPQVALYNGYGPTENTTFTTVHAIRDDTAPVPIGRPIRGTTTAVLGPDLRPVPPGTVGELFTGGAGVARGYLKRPELTQQRFLVVDGVRYYRTGDRVHQDEDGVLHFHGRTDAQVKVRGNRIEIGEILTALRDVPGVVDAHVLVLGAEEHDKQLVAYVVAPELDEAHLRAELGALLPPYTMPDRHVWLAALPLNANGKVDAAALPRPGVATPGAGHTAAMRPLAELWGEVLKLAPEAVPATASFFELGGNSIKLGVLLGRVDRRLGVRLPIADAFAAPTLAAMADAVARAEAGPAETIPAVPAGRPVALHPQQVSLYALWQAEPDSLGYNVPVRLSLRGDLDHARLQDALNALVSRHDAVRMSCRLTADGVRQSAIDGVRVPLEQEGDAAGFVRPFRLDQPPLLRARLVRAAADRHELYLDMPHVVVDGVSLRVLVSDLLALYTGAELPEVTATYASVAQWRHDRHVSSSNEQYWLTELADLPAGGDLPVDRPRGARRASRGAVVRRTVDRARAAGVEQVAHRENVTPSVVLLSAYVTALARLTRQRDLVVGTAMSGRTHPDVEDVVGMFVNTVCLRARLTGTLDLSGLCRQLGVIQRGALTHQDYPFDRLVRRLGAAGKAHRNPVFDAFFAYQDIEFYEFASGGLGASVEVLNPGTTRFDLNLQAYRRPDRLVLDLEYAVDLFDPATVGHLLDQCVAALDELADDPSAPVLPILSTELGDLDFAF